MVRGQGMTPPPQPPPSKQRRREKPHDGSERSSVATKGWLWNRSDGSGGGNGGNRQMDKRRCYWCH